MFRTVCPHCLQEYTLDEKFLGKRGTCAGCRKMFDLTEMTATRMQTASVSDDTAAVDSDFDLQLPQNESDSTLATTTPPTATETASEKSRLTDGSGEWKIGDIVLGTYEVLMLAPGVPFAEGGVGVVHRVRHREWDLDLAVKSPKPEVFRTENGKLSYEREAQTWIELGLHTNIVTCYMVRRIDNIPRLFAEFVADGSLRDWMRDGRLYLGGTETSLLRILDIATQFAWGLHHAHRRKLLHLDVKPANVMMSGMTAKVTDFGLAQGVSRQREQGTGTRDQGKTPDDGPEDGFAEGVDMNLQTGGMTPGYCSPEQYTVFTALQQGRSESLPSITLHSDIWSWAVSMLALFHGRPPCRKGGQTARKVFELFLRNEPPEGRPRIPAPLAELMLQCFEPNPRMRPESMEVVADRLTEIYREIAGSPFPRRKPVSASWTPESINNRAASMLDLDKPREAASLLSQAARMLPWHPEVTYNQTLLAWRNSRLTDLDALERLETLVKTRDSATSHYALGLIQREWGNPQSAMDAFVTALEREDRPDIRRAILATENVVANGCRCVERLLIPQGLERELWLDAAETHFLFPVDRTRYEMRDAVSGQVKMLFKRVTGNAAAGTGPSQSGSIPRLRTGSSGALTGNRVAMSENLQYELVPLTDGSGLVLRRVGTTKIIHLFIPVPWARISPKVAANPSRQSDPASAVNLAPDALPYATFLRDGMIDVIEKSNGRKIGDLFGHEGKITAIDFEPTGRFALSGGVDRTLRLWELPSCRCLHTFRSLGGSVDAVRLGKTGQFAFASIAGGVLRIFDLQILTSESSFRAPILLSHVSSSEEVGRQQAEMSERCDEIRQSVQDGDFKAATAAIDKAKTLATWETVRGTLDIWDPIIRNCRRDAFTGALCTQSLLGHHDTVSSVALSLDGTLAVSGSADNTIRIWSVAEGRSLALLEGHTDRVRAALLTQDTRYVISGSWDMSVRVWDVATGRCMRKFPEKIKSLTRLALHPQGRAVAIGGGSGAVLIWDMMQNAITGRFQAHDGAVNDLRFSRDGRYLITGGDDMLVGIWNIPSGTNAKTFKGHDAPPTAVLLSTDLSLAISGDRNGRLIVWNPVDGKALRQVNAHMSDLTAMEITADDRFLFTTGKDGKVRVAFLLDETERIIEGHPGPITSFAIDLPARRFATGCEDAVLRTWDLNWDFTYDGPAEPDARADAYLRTLLSLFCGEQHDKSRPAVDALALRRLRTEMEYRGFGAISPETMHAAVERLIANWSRTGRIVIK